MNRAQRLVVLISSNAVAAVLFLSAGPFSAYVYDSGALAEVLGESYKPKYPWNPFAGTLPSIFENPLVGIAVPLALVGLGLFVFFGKPKGGAGS